MSSGLELYFDMTQVSTVITMDAKKKADGEFFRSSYLKMIQDSRALVDLVRRCLRSGDLDSITRASHFHKNTCIVHGAKILADFCSHIQSAIQARNLALCNAYATQMEQAVNQTEQAVHLLIESKPWELV